MNCDGVTGNLEEDLRSLVTDVIAVVGGRPAGGFRYPTGPFTESDAFISIFGPVAVGCATRRVWGGGRGDACRVTGVSQLSLHCKCDEFKMGRAACIDINHQRSIYLLCLAPFAAASHLAHLQPHQDARS